MSDLMARVRKLHGSFVAAASHVQSPFLLLVRVYWGWQLAQNGWGKLHSLERVTAFFTSLNLPFPGQTAVFIATLEFVGGIFLAIGLFSRLTALVLTVDMLMAYIVADREALFSFIYDPDKFSAAAPFTVLLAALLVLIFGPGKISLDTLLERRASKGTAGPVRTAAG
jgi:putative oxidoreductase